MIFRNRIPQRDHGAGTPLGIIGETHSAGPVRPEVIAPHTVDWDTEYADDGLTIVAITLTCTECGASQAFPHGDFASRWAAAHSCIGQNVDVRA